MIELLPDQRRRRIVERIRVDGMVRVAALASELAVTEETIRRDLRQLDRQGILIRTHGGASAPSAEHGGPLTPPPLGDTPFEQRLRAMSRQKRAIARRAAEGLRPGQVVALDGSTTAWELARRLDRPGLTVVTNSLVVTNLLAARGDARVVCIGGTLDPKLQMFAGVLTEQALDRLHIDVAFFSCGGVDGRRGLSDPTDTAASFKRKLIGVADRAVLLADSTKIGRRAVVFFAEPGDIDALITDDAADPGALDAFRAAGVVCDAVPGDASP